MKSRLKRVGIAILGISTWPMLSVPNRMVSVPRTDKTMQKTSKATQASKRSVGLRTLYSMMSPVRSVPSDRPMLGPAEVMAVPNHARAGGAVSTTQDMQALVASPQESP